MGCPSEVILEESLDFSIVTHDPNTANIADASALPSYRVYEAQVGTALLTGTMAKLDDDNTTGCYSASIDCTAANGFEVGKNYTIYITATVAGVTGGVTYGFTCHALHDEAGTGAVAVNHDYGGADALTYVTSEGPGVDNATIHAFLTVDYDAGNRTRQYVKGASKTNADGQWEWDMYLDPGDYTIVFYKQNEYGPDTAEITVA